MAIRTRAFFCGVRAGDGGGVGAEGVLEGGQALVAELLAVAQEEGALELAGVGDAAQEVDRDERLARAGREAEEGARLAAGELLEDGADRGVLVVAPGALATLVGGDERAWRGWAVRSIPTASS